MHAKMKFKANTFQVFVCAMLAFSNLLAMTTSTLPALADDEPLYTINPPSKESQLTIERKLASGEKVKIGLVLGGGGARGGAHVGVLKVLEKNGIHADMVVGTSIGSIVGAFYAAGISPDVMESKFRDASLMRAFMTVPLSLRLVLAPILVTPRLIGFHPYDGLYYGNKFRKFLQKSLPQTEQDIDDLVIPYGAVVTNLVTGRTEVLTQGNLGYVMQASSAVPGLRKPVQIGEHLFVDGGVTDNLPVEQCRQMGADIIIAVNIDERLHNLPLKDFRKMGSVSRRMLPLQLWRLDSPQAAQADIVIHPNVDGISLISRSKEDGKKSIAAGIDAATEALPAIKSRLSQLRQGGLAQDVKTQDD